MTGAGGAPYPNGRQFVQRGSKRRLRRIRLRDYLGWGTLLFIAWVAFILFVIVPWLAAHYHFL